MPKAIQALVLSLALLMGNSIPAAPGISWMPRKALVLVSQDDPYFPLAQEIARTENLEIVHRFDDALAQNPEFLLWVVSPANLSDRVLVDLGLTINARHASVSIGIISGSSIEKASALWRRAAQVRGQRLFAVNGEFPTAQVLQGRIHAFDSDETQLLTKPNLAAALQQADYLTFTGHGGAGYLSLAPQNALTANDIPSLPPVVVSTASCQTFRLWRENSIALAFADQGAGAYAGFAFSPNEGFLMGEFDGLPFRYTWDEFPIGHVMQVQTRGTLRGFAAFPYYFLLGDPRIALQKGPPYRLIEDRQVGSTRTLTFADAPAGIVPVRISNGAPYRFVEIPGVASADDDDLFYNSRLQTANIGDAKYLLFRHAGGDFTVRLHRDVPLHWAILNPLRDSLDGALVFLQQNGGDFFSIGVGMVAWLMIGWRMRRRRGIRDDQGVLGLLPMALTIGLGFALVHGMYAWVRLGHITINEKPILFSPLSVIGTFILLAGTALLYLWARSRRGRAVAILLAILPLLVGAIIVATAMFAINFLSARQFGAGYYNYSLALMSLIAAAFEMILFTVVFAASSRLCKNNSRRVS